MKEKLHAKRIAAIIVALLIALLFLFTGCKTKFVPVEVEKIKTEYKDRHTRDSIRVLDSVIIKEKGDTVFYTRWRTEYKDRLIRDSIHVTDSIDVPVYIDRVKEVNVLKTWQKGLMVIGLVAIVLLVLSSRNIIKKVFDFVIGIFRRIL